MALTYLQKQAARVRAIRKANPRIEYIAAVKKAAKELKSEKKKPAKRAPAKRKAVGAYKVIERGETRKTRPTKVVRTVRTASGTFKGTRAVSGAVSGMGTVSGMMSGLRKMLIQDLGALEAKKFATPLKRDKAKLQKLITAKKAQIRKLS